MKLLRVGDFGKEKVAAIDKNNVIRDLSSHIDDLNPDTINLNNLIIGLVDFTNIFIKKKFESSL